jgi:hypothetical protein
LRSEKLELTKTAYEIALKQLIWIPWFTL